MTNVCLSSLYKKAQVIIGNFEMQEYIKALGRDGNQALQDRLNSCMLATHSSFGMQTSFASGMYIAAKICPFFHKQVFSIVLVLGGTDGLPVSQS